MLGDAGGLAPKTVRANTRHHEEERLESSCMRGRVPDQLRRLQAGSSQWIIAMVCGPPPQGLARWSVRLIAREAAKRKLAPERSPPPPCPSPAGPTGYDRMDLEGGPQFFQGKELLSGN